MTVRRQSNSKLKKVVKTVRGKHGSVRRTYYVQASPKKSGKLQNARMAEQRPGFLRRHAGKLVGAAALAGLAYANRKKLAGAASGARIGLSGKGSAAQRAMDAFSMAKAGFASRRGQDSIDYHMLRGRKAAQSIVGTSNIRQRATEWRKNTGADLAHHLSTASGEAAASHVGSRFGQVAGTAIGGMFAGPVGASIGGFMGGHVGNFLAGRHAAPHISRGASWLAERMRR